MNPKDDSFLSGSKGSFSPPGENLSSGSISILNKKLRVRKDKENRRYTLTRDNSEYNNYTGILKRKSFQLNNIKTKKYANYKVTYKESINYSDSEDVTGDKYRVGLLIGEFASAYELTVDYIQIVEVPANA